MIHEDDDCFNNNKRKSSIVTIIIIILMVKIMINYYPYFLCDIFYFKKVMVNLYKVLLALLCISVSQMLLSDFTIQFLRLWFGHKHFNLQFSQLVNFKTSF